MENEVSKSLWIIIGSLQMLLIKKPYRSGHTLSTRLIFWRGNTIQQWSTQLSQMYNINNLNKYLSSHSHLLSACFYGWKLWRTSWQEQNRGQCKSDTPCLVQRVWVQEWMWTKSQSHKYSWQKHNHLWKLKLTRTQTKWHQIVSLDTWGYSYYVVIHDFKVVLNLFT